MTRPARALVAGGSLGGLFCAALLLRRGWDVHVYERAAESLVSRGAGIVAHAALFDVLQEIRGVASAPDVGVRIATRVVLDEAGRLAGQRDFAQTVTSWGQVFKVLKSAFPAARYHAGKTLQTFEQDEACVRVQFTDGSQAEGDLLIAADGIHSRVRQLLLPDVIAQYAGYIAWRGLVDEAALPAALLRTLFPYFSFGLPPGEQILGYPIPGEHDDVREGHRRYNFVWYRPADAQTVLPDLLTDDSGKTWHAGIPPPRIRLDVLAQVQREARRVLPAPFAALVERATPLFFQPIADLESPQLVFGRVLLMGDAAFVARPHCGMGVTKAAADAQALAQALAHASLPEALAHYEQARLAFGRSVIARARELGAYLQSHTHASPGWHEASLRHRDAVRVMAETAAPPPWD